MILFCIRGIILFILYLNSDEQFFGQHANKIVMLTYLINTGVNTCDIKWDLTSVLLISLCL
jgi:hypothetical protein